MTKAPRPASADPDARPAARLALLSLLVVALVAGLLWLTGAVLAHRDDPLAKDREDVMSTTEQFALRTYTFTASELVEGKAPDYDKRIVELLTTASAEEFNSEAAAAYRGFRFLQIEKQEAKVNAVGVAEISEDKAITLVTGVHKTWPKGSTKAEEAVPLQFRWQLHLVKVSGEWKVSAFQPVTAGQGGAQPEPQPSASPSAQPTGGETPSPAPTTEATP